MRASSRAIRLPEALEHMRQKISLNAWSCVAHFDLRVRFILDDANSNRSSDGSKLRSVRQQVPHDLLQAIYVACDHLETLLKLRLDTNVLCFQGRFNCIERSIHN